MMAGFPIVHLPVRSGRQFHPAGDFFVCRMAFLFI